MAISGQANSGQDTSPGKPGSVIGDGITGGIGLFLQLSFHVGQPLHRTPLATRVGMSVHSSGINSIVHIMFGHIGSDVGVGRLPRKSAGSIDITGVLGSCDVTGIKSKQNINPYKHRVFLWSAKPDQTPQEAASDQVLHCLFTEVSIKI